MLTQDSKIKLKHGSEIPLVGFGTYLCTTEEAEHGVSIALSAGYRHIDTAEFYNNHEGIAAAIAKSGLKREEIFLTDKISPGGLFGQPERTYEETKALVVHNLQRLNTTYFDLFLIHHAFAKEERLNQYRALLDLQKEGIVREVGVSNWNVQHLEEITAAGLPMPSANQIEIHPLCTQSALIQYLNSHNIVAIAYSSLAPLGTWRTAEGQMSAKTDSNAVPNLLPEMAAKYNCSEAQVLLRWVVQHGYPVLPKSVKEDRIKANANLFFFEIDEADMKKLDDLDQNTPFAWPIGNPLNCP